MPNIAVTLSYNVMSPKRRLGSYNLHMTETDASVTNALRQDGPCINSVVFDVGIYASLDDAISAVFAYVEAPCSIVREVALVPDMDGDGAVERVRYLLREANARSAQELGWSQKVLRRNRPAGSRRAA